MQLSSSNGTQLNYTATVSQVGGAPNFVTRNQSSGITPFTLNIGVNSLILSQLGPGTRIQAAGPLIFDRAHGKPAPDGKNVEIGLEIHPLAGMSILSGNSGSTHPGQLSADLASAQGQADTLGQTLGSRSSLRQKMKGEAG